MPEESGEHEYSAEEPTPSEFMQYPIKYRAVFDSIESNAILKCSPNELIAHAKSLCVFHIDRRGQDQTAAALLIHHLLLSKIIKRVERSNRWTTIAVIIIGAFNLLVGVPVGIEATEHVIRQLTTTSKPLSPEIIEPRPEKSAQAEANSVF